MLSAFLLYKLSFADFWLWLHMRPCSCSCVFLYIFISSDYMPVNKSKLMSSVHTLYIDRERVNHSIMMNGVTFGFNYRLKQIAWKIAASPD